MHECPQTDTQSTIEHGLSVWSYTKKLISGQWENLRIPNWFEQNHTYIVNNLYATKVIKEYNIFHDCGKFKCITYDELGKRHFPNHAEVSGKTYKEYFPKSNSVISDLIQDDMALHTCTALEIESKNWSKQHAFTLLVTALAELHSNAQMFGGIESNSFKSKWKKLDRRGKQLCRKHIPESQYKGHSYLIIRNDLPDAQKTIQASHAALELGRTEDIVHPSLVAVKVRNEKKLKSTMEKLLDAGVSIKIFRDNLFNEEITAICTEPLFGEERSTLAKYQLL